MQVLEKRNERVMFMKIGKIFMAAASGLLERALS